MGCCHIVLDLSALTRYFATFTELFIFISFINFTGKKAEYKKTSYIHIRAKKRKEVAPLMDFKKSKLNYYQVNFLMPQFKKQTI